MFGRAVNRDAKVAAARTIRKKAVYCLDNIKRSCSEGDIMSYVKKLSVEVFTCHEVKPRRRRGEETPKDHKAFRLCIAADDRARLLDSAAWPDSIIISEWFFKSQDRYNGNDDRRVGTDTTTATNQQHREQQQQQSSERQLAAAAPVASASAGGYDESTILATSMDYHDGC